MKNKIFLAISIFTIVVAFLCCNKKSNTNNNIVLINCNNLVTDTAGKNDSARIEMPNAFTPNGDGMNDYFAPNYLYKIAAIDLTIYNDNNDTVFYTKGINKYWTPKKDTTFQYKKFYYRVQATTTNNNKIGLCGDLYWLNCIPSTIQASSLKFANNTGDIIKNCN